MNETLPSILRFRPWPPGDPAAPWILDQLDINQLVQLAKVELELNQAVLQAQLKANSQALEIIGVAKR